MEVRHMDGKIALEDIGRSIRRCTSLGSRLAFRDETGSLLVDFSDRRLADMDANGIELAILGLNSPALQAILDPAEASDVARPANDILAAEIAQSPGRFAGFAGLPMQDPGQRWSSPAA
jgi:predicted TIM-barrel fold metal-dependent hydrolase